MIKSNQKFSSSHMLTVKRGNTYYISSCVFISQNVALTAAHSLDGGDRAICNGVAASEFFIHPDYDPSKSNYLNDLGIIIFNKPMSTKSSISGDYSYPVFHRAGFGLRNEKNLKSIFMIKLLKSYDLYNQFFDTTSVIGDSGGGIFNQNHELVAIHSTKENNHTFAVRLSSYKEWITPYINKYDLKLHLEK